MPTHDPLRSLQFAARAAAQYFVPGSQAVRVIVIGPGDATLIEVAIPLQSADAVDAPLGAPEIEPGWGTSGPTVTFDGRPITVAPSRLKLLKTLIAATKPLSGKELARTVFDREADEENVRYHIRSLRTELAQAFPGFEGDMIPGEGGYHLVLR